MWYLFFLLAIIVTGVFIAFSSHKFKSSDEITSQIMPPDSSNKKLSKQDLAKKLQKLSETEAPKDMEMGAMCYKMAGPADRAEYICPKCGEKTLYGREHSRIIDSEIPKCRDLVKNIHDIEISLDESEFCRKCSPKITDPQLCIEIKTSDMTKANRTCAIRTEDLTILTEFLQGSLKHKDSFDYESPLKEKISALENMFSIKLVK